MNHFPQELLHQICLSLHADGLDSRATLSTFSRLNRTCYEVAAPFIYQHLSVIFWDPQTLQEVISGLTQDGRGRHFIKYASKLTIICLNPDSIHPEKVRPWQMEGCKLGLSRFMDDDLAAKDTFLESYLTDSSIGHTVGFHHLRDWSSYWKWERECGPLVALLARLNSLRQIDFFVQSDFPLCLQEAISQYHPNCQLKLWSRQNVSDSVPGLKNRASPQVRNRSSDDDWGIDFNLLRTQALHTFAVEIPHKSDPESGWTEIDEMLPFLFLAPNLKHLLLGDDLTRHRVPIAVLKEEWHKLALTAQPVPISSLQSISISEMGPYEDILPKLANIADISQLRSLQIGHLFDSASLAKIAVIFPNLERLFISTEGHGWRCPDPSTDDNAGIVGIRAFNPLKYLHLRGFRSVSSLNRIIQRHGPSLKGLIIVPCTRLRRGMDQPDSGYKYPEFGAFDISQLAESCPKLEELRLPIKRSMGSQEECEIYKAVGSFSKLYSLVLDLHFDPRPRPVSETRVIETPVLQRILVNAAMDEKLALQIWHLISSNQASRRLQYLRVVPFGLDYFPHDENRLLDWFARSFLITRYNFQNVGVPSVREIGKREREIRNEDFYQYLDDPYIPKRLEQLLSDLWPLEAWNKSWESGRSSFSLQSNDS